MFVYVYCIYQFTLEIKTEILSINSLDIINSIHVKINLIKCNFYLLYFYKTVIFYKIQ